MTAGFPRDWIADEPVRWQPRWTRQLADHPSQLRWHPDGRHLAAACLGGDVVVFDSASGDTADSFVRDASALCLAWAGDRLVSGYDDGVVAIDRRTVHLGGWIHDLATAPPYIVNAHGRRASLIEIDGHRCGPAVRCIAEHPTSMTSVAWHPSEARVLLGSHNRLEWIDVDGCRTEAVPIVRGGTVAALRSGAGHDWWVAWVRGDWSYTWQLSAPATVFVLPAPRHAGTLVAVDPTRARCVIASPQLTALFDMTHSDSLRQPSGQWLFALGSPSSVACHPRRQTLLCGVTVDGDERSAGILRWEPDRAPFPVGCIITPDTVVHLDWSPDGTLLALGLADGTVAVLDADHAAP